MNHTHKNPPCKRKIQSSSPLQTQRRQRKCWRGGTPEFDRGTVKFCVCPLELHDLDKLDNGFKCQSSHFNNNNKIPKSTCLVRMWWCTRTLPHYPVSNTYLLNEQQLLWLLLLDQLPGPNSTEPSTLFLAKCRRNALRRSCHLS